MKRIMAARDISSMMVSLDNFNTCKEVITIKQIPKRLDAAFKMCGDLSFGLLTIFLFN